MSLKEGLEKLEEFSVAKILGIPAAPNTSTSDTSGSEIDPAFGKNEKKKTDYSIAGNPYKYGGAAAVAAGLGALAIAKKMRAKKAAAKKKKS